MGLVLLDLCKAFDMVNHDILLQKRTIYRLSDSAIQWFKSYLSDMSQMAQYQQTMSEPMRVTSPGIHFGAPPRKVKLDVCAG